MNYLMLNFKEQDTY